MKVEISPYNHELCVVSVVWLPNYSHQILSKNVQIVFSSSHSNSFCLNNFHHNKDKCSNFVQNLYAKYFSVQKDCQTICSYFVKLAIA